MAEVHYAGEVQVTGNAGAFAQEIRIGNHVLMADEPVEHGGTDTGPNPCEFILAALGS